MIENQVATIPDRLKELKGDRTTAAFARFLGVGVSTLHNYENGRTPPIDFLLNVAACTGVSIEWLLTGRGEKESGGSYLQAARKTRRVLIVDDKEYQRDSICNVLEAEGYEIGRAANLKQSTEMLASESFDVVITDLRMPDENDGLILLKHIREKYPNTRTILITVHAATAPVAVEAIRSGAFDYLVMSRTFPDDLRSAVSRAITEIQKEETQSKDTFEDTFGEIIGQCPAIREAVAVLKKGVQSPGTPLLFCAEPGTGREFMAKVLHANDPERASHAFVPVKCGAMSEEVLNRELFGAAEYAGEHGEIPGVIAVADGGTVFLDEVEKIGPAVQVMLLRVLTDGTYTRVGEVQPRKADVRLICSTSANLVKEVAAGRFRQELLTHLSVLKIDVPPLREREGDIELLARRFLNDFAEEIGRDCRDFSPEAIRMLREESWPENIPGLKTTIKRAVLFSESEILGADDIAGSLNSGTNAPSAVGSPSS
ncbi:MAG TPA: sigma 54-interacting transcriptional regulator [bacterium]|nr:sigma 54-interacting transcriptional regulator [bacterium]HPO07025.1 sigma 54-interacting transcriptional regulator [bacterium]HQP97444.1 sigma 54-interacting transcriptional regulator [bacterium]